MPRRVKYKSPTLEFYGQLQYAYDFFNRELFEGRLPHVMLTAERDRTADGFFQHATYRRGRQDLHQIALNPASMRKDRETLSNLVHEMCHVEQHIEGSDPKNLAYHNKRFAELLERVGLIASDTGKPGGQRTGLNMSHYIKRNGPYARAYRQLRDAEFKLSFTSSPPMRRAASIARYLHWLSARHV